MGILEQFDHKSNATISKSKIPDYARNYRNEYLFIRGIDKTCENFVKTIKESKEIYNSSKALRIIRKIKKFKRLGYFNTIRRIRFEIDDVENIEFIYSAIEEYITIIHRSGGG